MKIQWYGKFLCFIAVFFFLTGFNIKTSDMGQKGRNRAEAANMALKRSLDLGVPDQNKIISLLNSDKFSEVEKEYDEILQKYKKDVDYESRLTKAYALFNTKIRLVILDKWIKTTDSYVAYAARGFYKVQIGERLRGTKYIKDTPPENLENMRKYFSKASDDFHEAIKREPALMPAYCRLIRMAKITNMGFTEKEILDAAVKVDPRTYYVRGEYVLSLIPRWGGSYEEIKEYTHQLENLTDLNPRLWTLQGEVYEDIGSIYAGKKDIESAIHNYSLALQFGDLVHLLFYRANCYAYLNKTEEALADYRKILYYDPNKKYAKSQIDSLTKKNTKKI